MLDKEPVEVVLIDDEFILPYSKVMRAPQVPSAGELIQPDS
jgi:hypothetical protein